MEVLHMKSRRIILVTMLCLGVLVSPYTLNVSVNASGQEARRDLVYFSDTEASEVVNYVKETSTDDSVVKEQALLKKDKMDAKAYTLYNVRKVSRENPTDIAYPIDYVRENKEIQQALKESLEKGKVVYLYGGLTLPDYKEVIGLDEMTMTVLSKSGKPFVFDLGETGDTELATYDVIGFSKRGLNSIYQANITITEDREPTNYHYLREILYYIALDNEKREKNQKATANNILNMTTSSADSTIRDSSDRTTYASAYDIDTLAGRVFTDWQLSQHTNESQSEWDYFSLWQGTYLEAYNGYHPTGDALDIEHSLPYSKDDLQDVDPDDTPSSPYSISIGSPWSIGLSFSMNSDPNVDQYFNGMDEYATLDVDGMGTNDQFEPQAAWKSGTSSLKAALDINNIADFENDCFTCGTARAEHDINVRYSYSSSSSPGY
jgi:hypothetical protein